MAKSTYYCKAGFEHVVGSDCDHIVTVQFNVPKKAEARPAIVPDDFYSEQATARRRAENRQRYQPIHRPFNRHRIAAAVNDGDR
jgi:hypothetical protein